MSPNLSRSLYFVSLHCLPLYISFRPPLGPRFVFHFVSHFVSLTPSLSLTLFQTLFPTLSPVLSRIVYPHLFPTATLVSQPGVSRCVSGLEPWNALCRFVSHGVSIFVPGFVSQLVSPIVSGFVSHCVPHLVSHLISHFVSALFAFFCPTCLPLVSLSVALRVSVVPPLCLPAPLLSPALSRSLSLSDSLLLPLLLCFPARFPPSSLSPLCVPACLWFLVFYYFTTSPALSITLSLTFFPLCLHFVSNLSLTMSYVQLVSIYCVSRFVLHFVWRLFANLSPACVSPTLPLCIPFCPPVGPPALSPHFVAHSPCVPDFVSLCLCLCPPLCLPVCLPLCFKLCLPLCPPLCLPLCHPPRLPLCLPLCLLRVSDFASVFGCVSNYFVSHFVSHCVVSRVQKLAQTWRLVGGLITLNLEPSLLLGCKTWFIHIICVPVYHFSPTLPMCFPRLCLCCGYLGLLLVFQLLLLCLCFTYGLLAGISSALDISLFWLVEVNAGIVSNLKPPTKSNPWMISYPIKWGLCLSDAQNTCYYAQNCFWVFFCCNFGFKTLVQFWVLKTEHLNDTCF